MNQPREASSPAADADAAAELARLRAAIDRVDRALLELLNERARLGRVDRRA